MWNAQVAELKAKRRYLDLDARFIAPARSEKNFDRLQKIFSQTVWGEVAVRPWEQNGMKRLYFPDRTYLYVDSTGAIGSSGGMATRAKFEHQLK